MRAHRRRRAVLIALLAAYAAAGAVWELRRGWRREIFPLSSWPLFRSVPRRDVRDFALRWLSLNGEPLPGRPLLAEAPFLRRARSSTTYELVQRLGRALSQETPEDAARLRRLLEAYAFQGVRAARYEIVERRYDPLELYRGGGYASLRAVAVFTLERAGP